MFRANELAPKNPKIKPNPVKAHKNSFNRNKAARMDARLLAIPTTERMEPSLGTVKKI